MDDFFDGPPAGEQPAVAAQEDFTSFEAPPAESEGTYAPPQNGILEEDGAKLPPPSQMGPEESILLREWRRKKALELEEKARVSREKHSQVIEDAKAELESFYKKRELQVTQAKANNRDKEKAYVENLTSLNANQGANYWESVCRFVNFDVPKKEKAKAKGEPQRTSSLLNEGKATQKHTDLARMRQVLLKLKHNPPPSFNPAASTTIAAK